MIIKMPRPFSGRLLRILALILGSLVLAGWLSGIRLMAYPGRSMEPAVKAGDHFIALTGLWSLRSIKRFDMAVYDVPPNNKWADRKIPWMKRVVGMPGEHIRISGTELFVDGRKIDAPFYGTPTGDQKLPAFEVKLGPDQFFMLGDNLNHSFDDSRSMGPIHQSLVRGFVAYVIRTSPEKKE
ncbi:MAG: signal peptidase I [Opitutaceae bacterium]|nr:signal peptidase I [Opitutaceae bacterium]